MTPYDEGYCDFAAMQDINPYPIGTDEFLEWSAGHIDAATDFYDREQIVI